MDSDYEFKSNVKRRKRHPQYAQNKKRLHEMLSPFFGPAFMQDNHPFNTVTTATGKVMFRNPVDYEALDKRKWELSLTNNDILMLFRSLSNGSDGITAATLTRKLQGEIDFTAGEILLLAQYSISRVKKFLVFSICSPNNIINQQRKLIKTY